MKGLGKAKKSKWRISIIWRIIGSITRNCLWLYQERRKLYFTARHLRKGRKLMSRKSTSTLKTSMVVRKISKQLSSRLMKMQRTCLRRLCHPHFLKEKSLTLSRRRRSCCSKLTSRSKTRWSLSGPLMNKVKIPWLHLIRAAERTTCRLSSQRLEMKPWSSLLKRVLSLPRNWQVGSWQVLSRFNNCFQLRNSMDLRTHAHSKPPSRHTDKPLTLRKRHHSFLKNCKASSKVSREELVRKDYKPCRPE